MSFDRIVMIVYVDEAYIALTSCLFVHQLQMKRTEVGVLTKRLCICIRRLRRDSPDDRVSCVDDNRYEFEGVGGTAADTKTD